MADPHAMPVHPTVNNPKSHKAFQKKNATQHHAGTKKPVGPMSPTGDASMAPPPGVGYDADSDGM